MSKHWKPARKAIQLQPTARPSRIRRDPVRLEKKVEERSREREIVGGVAGILLFAASIVAVIVGIAIATIVAHDPKASAADAVKFGQCYNSDGSNCVVDGDTIYVDRARVQLAGIEAPEINAARCQTERGRGIAAAVGLSDLLQSGTVTVSQPFRDEYGRVVQSMQVDGRDVAEYMTSHSLVRRYTGEKQNWCS